MPGALQIPWEEYAITHNRLHGTDFKTSQEMVMALYEREGTLEKVSIRLGVSVNAINRYMMKWGLPRMNRGHREPSEFQIAYRKIRDPEQYKNREIAKILGCSTGYISGLRKNAKKQKKRSDK